MAARRLLIVMLVLLGISTLAAALVPPQNDDRTTSTETTEEPQPTDTLPRGELLRATIRTGSAKRTNVPLKLGDQLLLTVHSKSPDQVEIPGLGLVEPVDRFTPARFDLLPSKPGSYPIKLVAGAPGDRVIGNLVVTRPKRKN